MKHQYRKDGERHAEVRVAEHVAVRIPVVGRLDPVVDTVGAVVVRLIADLGASKNVPPIEEFEYDNIYLVSIPWFGKTKTIRLRFGEPYQRAAGAGTQDVSSMFGTDR